MGLLEAFSRDHIGDRSGFSGRVRVVAERPLFGEEASLLRIAVSRSVHLQLTDPDQCCRRLH